MVNTAIKKLKYDPMKFHWLQVFSRGEQITNVLLWTPIKRDLCLAPQSFTSGSLHGKHMTIDDISKQHVCLTPLFFLLSLPKLWIFCHRALLCCPPLGTSSHSASRFFFHQDETNCLQLRWLIAGDNRRICWLLASLPPSLSTQAAPVESMSQKTDTLETFFFLG